MSVDHDLIHKAVVTTMAAEILKSISSEDRNCILEKSISDTLKDYKFNNAIREVVADAAKEHAKVQIESQLFQDRLNDAIINGIDMYLQMLPIAVCKMMTEVMHGENNGGYNRAGLILKHLKLSQED